jgi:hypothetical protein
VWERKGEKERRREGLPSRFAAQETPQDRDYAAGRYCSRLFDPLENLVQWRFLSFGGGVSRLGLASACVATLRVVLIGGCHDIAHIHIPGAIPELAYLVDLHPVPAIPHHDVIVRADSDAFATLLQDHLFSWTD